MEVQLRPNALTWHVVGTDVVVLDLEGSVYLKLNDSGRVLWERLAEAADANSLAAALVDAYGIEEGRAKADVEEFVGELRRRGLLAA